MANELPFNEDAIISCLMKLVPDEDHHVNGWDAETRSYYQAVLALKVSLARARGLTDAMQLDLTGREAAWAAHVLGEALF